MLPCPLTETQRIANSHLRKVSVSESNVLLDEEVLTDPKIQMLLLTVLVRNFSVFFCKLIFYIYCPFQWQNTLGPSLFIIIYKLNNRFTCLRIIDVWIKPI